MRRLKPWKVEFKPGWDKYFRKFDKPIQKMIVKKLDQLEKPMTLRGLHSFHYLVEGVGQYRIGIIQDKKEGLRKIHFIGNHKQYEKWYKKQFERF